MCEMKNAGVSLQSYLLSKKLTNDFYGDLRRSVGFIASVADRCAEYAKGVIIALNWLETMEFTAVVGRG